jgi:hypothetical protein
MARKAMYYYGKVFLSNDTGYYQIVLANNIERMKAIFLTTNTEVWVSADQVDNGTVFDRYFPTVHGVGCLGDYSTLDQNGNTSKEYATWRGMLERCYGSRKLEAYKYCIVSEEFLNASYFKDWYNEQYGAHREDFHLDKDILSGDCKVYAEDTCVLVPHEINMFFAKTGGRTHQAFKDTDYPIGVSYLNKSTAKPFVAKYNNGGNLIETYHDNEWSAFLAYKQAKENRAKELAEKWRGQIDNRVYEKLINYKVLLTD